MKIQTNEYFFLKKLKTWKYPLITVIKTFCEKAMLQNFIFRHVRFISGQDNDNQKIFDWHGRKVQNYPYKCLPVISL